MGNRSIPAETKQVILEEILLRSGRGLYIPSSPVGIAIQEAQKRKASEEAVMEGRKIKLTRPTV